MNRLKTEQLRKTGMVVDFECRMQSEKGDEFLYVFGVAVRGIVYKCHYISKELLEIEVGDFVLFNGSLCELRMGFAVTYMVEVHVLTLLKLKDMKEFSKDHILIADYRMVGYKLKNNQQNGFIIHRDNKHGFRLRNMKPGKKYGVFYKIKSVDNTQRLKYIDEFEYTSELQNLCLKKYVSDKYDFNKMCIVDFEGGHVYSFLEFCKDIFKL